MGDGVDIVAAQFADLKAVVNLTMAVFFGELGSDYGFNNNRAYKAQFHPAGERLAEPFQSGAPSLGFGFPTY